MESSEFVAHFRQAFPDLVGGRVLVALSGGRDSVALLHLLREPELDLQLEAAHVHHRLRGAEADADAEFCLRHCRELGIPVTVLELAADTERPGNGEAAWRRRRYRSLLSHAAAHGSDAVATGHHRDDVAEGFVLQLLRGAGPRALSGIAARTPDGVIRPILPWAREQIGSWLEERGLTWREDSSNADLNRLRNRVRHGLLPELESASAALRRHLVRLAATLADDEAFLSAEVRRRAPFIDPWHPDGGVGLATLRALPAALRGRWLHGQVEQLGIGPATRRQREALDRLLDTGRPRAVTVAGRWRLRAARGRLWAEPPKPPPGITTTIGDAEPTALAIPGWFARVRADCEADPGAVWRRRARFDDGFVTVRPAAADDQTPLSGGRRRPVRRLIAEAIPRHLRPGWPVFCENGMIYWIPGVWQHPNPGGSSSRMVEVIRR